MSKAKLVMKKVIKPCKPSTKSRKKPVKHEALNGPTRPTWTCNRISAPVIKSDQERIQLT